MKEILIVLYGAYIVICALVLTVCKATHLD